MTLGKTPLHEDLYRSSTAFCQERLGESSIYRLLHEHRDRLFPDESFADLFAKRGRSSVPPAIVAVVMVLQRLEGLSDREAVDRFAFDLRWKYAAGGLDFDRGGFVHTVLVDMRERLRRSERPDRIFEAVREVAKQAGLIGRKRVLDSTALYDAVATQDTVTLIRSAIRSLLSIANEAQSKDLRAVLRRDDDYLKAGKPACDWEDAAAREALVDALALDGFALLQALEGRPLSAALKQAAELLGAVLGQDLEKNEQGGFRIARRVAPDRVISTVDPESRHGHKTAARGFDGYKGHVAIDPDSEIITATEVTAGNEGDATPAERLLGDLLTPSEAAVAETPAAAEGTIDASSEGPAAPHGEVYGDASYGTADLLDRLEASGLEANTKVQLPSARDGKFSQEAFKIDTSAGTVCCPNGVEVPLRGRADGSRYATFVPHCADCPLREKCTSSKTGRQIAVHPKHDTLQRARARQRDAGWKRRYRANRPKIERKIGHLMRRKHGGRRVRVRGRLRIGRDFSLLAAAVNLQRLAVLRVRWTTDGWTRPA